MPSGDADAMARVIEQAAALSREQLAQMAEAGRAIIRKDYDYRVVADRYLEMLEGL